MALLFRPAIDSLVNDVRCSVARTRTARCEQRAAVNNDCAQCAQHVAALTYNFVSEDMYAASDLQLMTRALITLHLHGMDGEIWAHLEELQASYSHADVLAYDGPATHSWRLRQLGSGVDAAPALLPASLWNAIFSCMVVPLSMVDARTNTVHIKTRCRTLTTVMDEFVPFHFAAVQRGALASQTVALFFVRHMLAHKNAADVLEQPFFKRLAPVQRQDILSWLRASADESNQDGADRSTNGLTRHNALRSDLTALLRNANFAYPGQITLPTHLPYELGGTADATLLLEEQQESDVQGADDTGQPTTPTQAAIGTERFRVVPLHSCSVAPLAQQQQQRDCAAAPQLQQVQSQLASSPQLSDAARTTLRSHIAVRQASAHGGITTPHTERYLPALVGTALMGTAATELPSLRNTQFFVAARDDARLATNAGAWHSLFKLAYGAHDAHASVALPQPVERLNASLDEHDQALSASQRIRRYVTAMGGGSHWAALWRAEWPLSTRSEQAVNAFRASSPIDVHTADALVRAVAH